jgi:uncharacterized protein YqhQ
MVTDETLSKESRLRVRPGLLLFFIGILVLAIYSLSRCDVWLADSPKTVTRSLLLLATASTAYGWFVFRKEFEHHRSWRMWVALAGSIVLSLWIPAYVLFTVIPVKFYLSFRMLLWISAMAAQWHELPVELAWPCLFFARGRSRIAFVVGGTLMLFLWGATYHLG